MAILASALVTLPAALSADVAVSGWVNAADRGPLAKPSTPGATAGAQGDLGATGAEPHDTQLSQQIIHNANDPSALATGAGQQANVPRGPLGIPGVVLDAYTHAQQVMSVEDPGCHLPWWLLAGIGQEESGQAENGAVDSNGTTLSPILGPALNGTNGNAAIPAYDGGKWTGDPVWDHAIGPMQFISSSWLEWGRGGNPDNVYDSALAAGRYLCAGGGDLSNPAQQATAVFSYNHSDSYVRIVLIWANAYRNGVTPIAGSTTMPQFPQPTNGVPFGSGGSGGTGGSGGHGSTGGTGGGGGGSTQQTTSTTKSTSSSGTTITTTTTVTTTTTPRWTITSLPPSKTVTTTTTTQTCPPPTTTTTDTTTPTTTPTPPPPGCTTTTTTTTTSSPTKTA